ncbi:hypothetical protein, partial [Xanthomonas fragariae]|uniref:hypothetical protein n=1 Tax=Xanthomonas fragariae TaxID=48664 RepID=UPI001F286B87
GQVAWTTSQPLVVRSSVEAATAVNACVEHAADNLFATYHALLSLTHCEISTMVCAAKTRSK